MLGGDDEPENGCQHPHHAGRVTLYVPPAAKLVEEPKRQTRFARDVEKDQLGPGCIRASWIFRWTRLTGQGDVQRTIIVELNGFWVVTCVVYYVMIYAVQLLVILVLDSGG